MAKKIMLDIDTTEVIQKINAIQKETNKFLKQIPLRVNASAGDTIIFTHPNTLSDSAYDRLVRHLETIYTKCKVVILEEGVKLTGCIKFTESDNSEEHF